MSNSIKIVVFDMAGTTINENNLVYHCLHQTITQNGFPCTIDDVLLHGAGKEKRNAIVDIVNAVQSHKIDDSTIDNIFNSFLKNLNLSYQSAVVSPQPNSEFVFEKLRKLGILIVLNTGYDRKTAIKLLEKLNWVRGLHYDLLVTASDVKNSRPHPDMIFYAMSSLNVTDAISVVKIGDSEIDIIEGKNANCGITIGITTGAQTATQMRPANPDYIIDNLIELLTIIKF